MYIDDQAIIMARKKVKSSDIIITVLTKEHGKTRIYANRARNARSKLSAETQLFASGYISYQPKKDFASLKEMSLIKARSELSNDIGRFYLATYIMELLDKSLFEGDVIFGLYNLIEQALNALIEAENLLLFKLVIDLKLLKTLGLEPCFTCCSFCGKEQNLLPVLNIEHGGVLCRDCKAQSLDNFIFGLEDLKMINFLLKKPFATMQREVIDDTMLLKLDAWLNQFIQTHLISRPLKSLELLKTIL